MQALAHPTALVDAPRVRALIDKQCEVLRALELHPEMGRCLHLGHDEIEQTIAAHQLALRYLRETP
jgi:hypothetical protein